jgi:hypothetical protein
MNILQEQSFLQIDWKAIFCTDVRYLDTGMAGGIRSTSLFSLGGGLGNTALIFAIGAA